ncbi:MAG: DUF5362 family protein [Rhodothermales bacterium]
MDETTRRSTTERLAERARSMSGWLRFMGVVTVGAALPSIMTIVGIVFAWLPIWLGILLFQAGSSARRGSDEELIRMIERLRLYFIVQSVVIIIGLVAFALAFAFFGSIVFDMMREMGPPGRTWEV